MVVAAAVVAGREARGLEDLCRRTASRLDGTFVEGEGSDGPRIRFRIREREAELDFLRAAESAPSITRVRVDLRGISPGFLRIAPEGFGDRLFKLFGSKRLEVGDRAFDEAYVVQASAESVVRRIFAPDQRRRAVASVWSIHRFSGPSFDLSREQLIVQVREGLVDERDLLALVDAARVWLDLLLPDEKAVGITWMEATQPTQGTCPVCGSPLREAVVRCASCRTAHHRECWEYIGECSTYACRERRFS